jgi:hypothetical protein
MEFVCICVATQYCVRLWDCPYRTKQNLGGSDSDGRPRRFRARYIYRQLASAKFRFPQGLVPTDGKCSWSPSEQFLKPNDCETTIVAPRSTGLYPNGIVPVQVTVTTGDLKLTSEIFNVTVHYPPAKLFDFVLDATTNMKSVMDGVALLDRAKASINSQILRLQPAGGWLVVVGFGQDVPAVRDDCDRYKPVYPLARINAPEAETALKDVHIVGQLAPLAKSIDTAVKQYSDLRPFYPNKEVERYFVLLTASTNGCQNMTLADALAEVQTAFRNNGLEVQYYGQAVFTSLIVVPTQGAKPNQVYSTSAYQSERNHTLLIVADSPNDIEEAVNAITNLLDAEYAVRQRGCSTLRRLLSRSNDKKGEAILSQQRQCKG